MYPPTRKNVTFPSVSMASVLSLPLRSNCLDRECGVFPSFNRSVSFLSFLARSNSVSMLCLRLGAYFWGARDYVSRNGSSSVQLGELDRIHRVNITGTKACNISTVCEGGAFSSLGVFFLVGSRRWLFRVKVRAISASASIPSSEREKPASRP